MCIRDRAIDSVSKELASGDEGGYESRAEWMADLIAKEDLSPLTGDDGGGWSDFRDDDNDFDSKIWSELWSGIEVPASTDFDHDREDDNDEKEFTFDPTGMN